MIRLIIKGFLKFLKFMLLFPLTWFAAAASSGGDVEVTTGNRIIMVLIGVALTIYWIHRLFFKKSNIEIFNEKLNEIQNDGYIITYANENTGTISYRDENNVHRSVQVYEGYNSHWKRTE